MIISPLFTLLFSRKLGQPCTQLSLELKVREASHLISGLGGCSMGMEPIDGKGTLFSGWRQQSMLKKARRRTPVSVSSEPPEEGDGVLAGGLLEIGLSFPTSFRIATLHRGSLSIHCLSGRRKIGPRLCLRYSKRKINYF